MSEPKKSGWDDLADLLGMETPKPKQPVEEPSLPTPASTSEKKTESKPPSDPGASSAPVEIPVEKSEPEILAEKQTSTRSTPPPSGNLPSGRGGGWNVLSSELGLSLPKLPEHSENPWAKQEPVSPSEPVEASEEIPSKASRETFDSLFVADAAQEVEKEESEPKEKKRGRWSRFSRKKDQSREEEKGAEVTKAEGTSSAEAAASGEVLAEQSSGELEAESPSDAVKSEDGAESEGKDKPRRRRRRGRGRRGNRAAAMIEEDTTHAEVWLDETQEAVIEEPDGSFEKPAAAAGEEGETEDEEKPARKRPRRRRRRSSKGKEASTPTEASMGDEDHPDYAAPTEGAYSMGGLEDEEDDFDEDTPGASGERVPRHQNIPTWDDAIGMIVTANMESRTTRKPSHNGRSSRGRSGGNSRRPPRKN